MIANMLVKNKNTQFLNKNLENSNKPDKKNREL
jgi:hypothetical protein